jgi:hypothetical protein
MTPPTSFFFPCRLNFPSDLSPSSHPLLVTSQTPAELVTFAIKFAQQSPRNGRLVLITTQDRTTFLSSLNSTLFTSFSSSLASTSLILASDNVTLYQVETLAHLRVLLSSLQHSKVAFLGVDSFISLHETASELSAQGISRTLAGMVNVTSPTNGVLVLREPRETVELTVPILNSGVGGGSLSSATVSMIRVLGRWVRGFWHQDMSGEGNCSADWTCCGEKWRVEWSLQDGEIDDVQILKN